MSITLQKIHQLQIPQFNISPIFLLKKKIHSNKNHEFNISIKSVVESIHRKEFLLPAIQREFVWSQEQIVVILK